MVLAITVEVEAEQLQEKDRNDSITATHAPQVGPEVLRGNNVTNFQMARS